MLFSVGVVVEGHGEMEAVPLLIRRVVQQIDPLLDVHIPHPVRLSRSKLSHYGELERAVTLAAANAGQDGVVLVVLDSDDDCPARLGPALLDRARAARSDLPVAVVLAKYEYENWFLAAAESLRGRRGLPDDIESPANSEAIRGAKEWLSDRMLSDNYVPTLHQAAFTASFDLVAAQRADSFSKCWRSIASLVDEVRQRHNSAG